MPRTMYKLLEMAMATVMAMALVLLCSAAAGAQSLVSPDEMRLEEAALAGAPPRVMMKALPPAGVPAIAVQAPTGATALVAPFEIRIRFVPQDDARIDPDSFKVLYGMLGLDITSRVLKLAQFQDNVLRIEKADIPAGKHRLTLKIKDSKQREGQVELAVVVRDNP